VLVIIFIYKSLIVLGGGIMAFFIRQVDRRFSATTALGWAFFNMFLTVIIAFGFSFETNAALEAALFIPIFCGLWIVFFTLGALTLDSNVLLACRDFSKPLRRLMKTGSKESKDRNPNNKKSHSGDAEAESSAKVSTSSTIFVVNREMFPSKYDDFQSELLEQILNELKFQLSAVRRAMIPAAGSAASTTMVELTEQAERHRNSTQVGGANRFESAKKFSIAPASSDSHASSHSGETSPRNDANITFTSPEPLTKTASSDSSPSVCTERPTSSVSSVNPLTVLLEPSILTHSDSTSVEMKIDS
jgi:hypothetical protein